MDPFQEISDQCKVSISQAEIFEKAVADTDSKRKPLEAEDDSRISKRTVKKSHAERNLGFSDTKVEITSGSTARDSSNTPRSLGNADGIRTTPDLWLSKGKIPSEMDLGFFKRMQFLISSRAFPDLNSLKESGVLLERDLGFFERMKFLISRGQLPDLGFPKTKEDSSESLRKANLDKPITPDASSPINLDLDVDPSNTLKESDASKSNILSEWVLPFYDRMKFLVSSGAFPDLESLKQSGILSERDLLLFQRMKSLISKGALPDLGFPNPKEDSRVGNLQTSAPDAFINLDAQVCGDDGKDLQVSSKSMVDSSDKFKDDGPETNIQRDVEPEVPNEKFSADIDLEVSKSKGDSSGVFSSKDLEVLQKSIALLVAMKDANALGASHDPLDKRSASIFKNKSPIEKISGIIGSRNLPGPEKDRTKSPAHEDLGPQQSTEEDAGQEKSGHSEDTGPRDEFARFRYCQSGKPRNHPRSTLETETIRIANTVSHTRQIGRKLPPSLQGLGVKKVPVSHSCAKSRDAASQNEIIKNLLDFVRALSKESDWSTADEDILEVAEGAGYTFPQPRWWPPGDCL